VASATEIFAALKPKTAVVEVGGVLIAVRELSLASRMHLATMDPDNTPGRLAFIAQAGCEAFDEVSSEELADKLPATALVEIANAVMDVSGLMGDDTGN